MWRFKIIRDNNGEYRRDSTSLGLQILTHKVLEKPKTNSLQELKSLNIGSVWRRKVRKA